MVNVVFKLTNANSMQLVLDASPDPAKFTSLPVDYAAGTDALLSSFDSINVMRPPAVTHPASCFPRGLVMASAEVFCLRLQLSAADVTCRAQDNQSGT